MFSERRTLLVFDVEECLEYREGPASLSCFVDFTGGWEEGLGSRGGIDVCLIIFARFIRSWTTRWTHVDVYNVYLYFLLAVWKFIIYTRRIDT